MDKKGFGYYFDATIYGYAKSEHFTNYVVKDYAAEKCANDNEFIFVEIESTLTDRTGDFDNDGEITSNDSLNLFEMFPFR